MNLLELQRRMSDDVMRPLTPDFAMRAMNEQGLPSDEIAASYIKPNSLLTSFERLEIYNRQYWFRVIDAVSEDFPRPPCRSRPGEIRLAGAGLPARESVYFLYAAKSRSQVAGLARRYPELTGPQHALAVDVARLEWAYIEAFDGASLMPLGWEDFAGLGRDSTLRLQPHLQLLDLQYPVDDVVLAVHKVTPAIDIVSNAVSERRQSSEVTLPEVSRSNVYLAVHRFDDSVYYRRIEREEFLLLADLRDGDLDRHCNRACVRGQQARSGFASRQDPGLLRACLRARLVLLAIACDAQGAKPSEIYTHFY